MSHPYKHRTPGCLQKETFRLAEAVRCFPNAHIVLVRKVLLRPIPTLALFPWLTAHLLLFTFLPKGSCSLRQV